MATQQIRRYWIVATVAFAIVWSLLAYASHTHPARQAGGQDVSCDLCADLARTSTPPKLPQLLLPVAQILLPYRTDTVPVAAALPLPAYRSRAPPAV